jgi:hypothetical protein
MSVLTLYYIIADFIFLACIISSMMRAYEKKSSVQSIGKGGGLSSTDVAIESGIFECLERAAEESSRDKGSIRKFNGENPAEWLATRKIAEDWLNSIGCLHLILQGNKQHQGMSYGTTPLNYGRLLSTNGGHMVGFAQGNRTMSTLSYPTAGMFESNLPTTPSPPQIRSSLTGIRDDSMGLSTSEQDLLDGRAGDLQPPMVLDSSSGNATNNSDRRRSMHYGDSMEDEDVLPSTINELLGTVPKFDELLEKLEKQMAEVRGQQGEVVDEAVVNARVTKLTSEYETSVRAEKARLEEAIALSEQRTERLKRREMEATRKSMVTTSNYAVANPMSITGGSINSSQSGIADLKFRGEHWDKKITKVQTVFRSLLETCVLNLITTYLRDNDFSGAWSYLNDMYLGRLEDHVVPIISALDVYVIKHNQTFARYYGSLKSLWTLVKLFAKIL